MDGINKDEGKLRLDLVSPEASEAIARVAGQACESGKYPERNWEKGMDWSRQYASCQRHLLKWMKGQDNDPDTGLPHLEHALWRLAALVTYARRNVGRDDRPSRLEDFVETYEEILGYDKEPDAHQEFIDDELKAMSQQDEGRIDPGPQAPMDFAEKMIKKLTKQRDIPCPMGDPDCPVCS